MLLNLSASDLTSYLTSSSSSESEPETGSLKSRFTLYLHSYRSTLVK